MAFLLIKKKNWQGFRETENEFLLEMLDAYGKFGYNSTIVYINFIMLGEKMNESTDDIFAEQQYSYYA